MAMDDFSTNDAWLPGTRPSVERPQACYVCGEAVPKTKCIKYKGNYYGIPCGCYKDIQSLRRLEGK